jgi:hypothetical protein
MSLKRAAATAAIVLLAVGSSMGVTQLRAAQEPILSYCPSHAGAVDCATAVKLFLQFGKPSDDELISIINTIVAQLAVGRHSPRSVANTAEALGILAGAIDDSGQRAMAADLAQTVAENVPPPSNTGGGDGDGGGNNGNTNGSNTSSSSGSGSPSTSGDQTSGSTGSTSGDQTSGSTSGSSGSTSGDETSGGTSGSSGSTSGDETSGSTSGSSGSTRGDDTSGGTSGSTSSKSGDQKRPTTT